VTIPNVYTMDAATATATLESAGFKVKTRKQASDQTSGTVIAVTPDVGESAPRGSEVVLVIAK
jgi:beta-lactam-binding protein with PASTA domain